MIHCLIFQLALAQAPGDSVTSTAGETLEIQARSLFEHGRDAYEHGRYEDAIEKWEEAWRLSRRPLLLSNLANAYERLGQLEHTAELLEQYLELAPSDERDALQARIAQIEARLTLQKAEEQHLSAQEMQREAAQITENQRHEAANRAALLAAQKTPPPVMAWISGAVGLTGVALGVQQHLAARSTRDELTGYCPTRSSLILCSAEATPLIEQHNRQRTVAITSYAIGAVGMGATGWLMLKPTGQQVTLGVQW